MASGKADRLNEAKPLAGESQSASRTGMTTQITVRLPDDLVTLVDALVSSGQERSRASVVERALERELRRAVALRDAAILQGAAPVPGLDALAAWAQRHVDVA